MLHVFEVHEVPVFVHQVCGVCVYMYLLSMYMCICVCMFVSVEYVCACCQCVYISACVIASLFLPLTWVLCAESKRAYHLSRDMKSSSDETNGPLPDDRLALYSILSSSHNT